MKMPTILLAIAVVALACERGQPAEPLDDDIDACKPACDKLRTLGCPEGQPNLRGQTCERSCASAIAMRPLPLVCWAEAQNVVAAKTCGSLRCVR